MTKFLVEIMFIAGLLVSLDAFAVKPDTMERLPSGIGLCKEITYTEGAIEPLTMDLFLPRESGRAVPCIVVIQGGGFLAQNGQLFRPFAECFAENGFSAALISYRGRPDHTYRDSVADAKAAVRFIRKSGSGYGIDPDRIGAMGRSAGATLAVLLAVTGGMDEFEGSRGNAEVPSRIQAAVGMAGVYDFVGRFSDPEQVAAQPQMKAKIRTNGEWIGTPFSLTDSCWLDASAVNHLDPDDPPILLMHSRDDRVLPWMQSRNMFLKLQDVGVPSILELYETGGHAVQPKGKDPKAAMISFFKAHLEN